MPRVRKNKINVRKTKVLNKIKKKFKNDIKDFVPSPEVIKEVNNLPPNKRKSYLKKLLKKFLNGAAIAAGAAATLAIAYKISKPLLKRELNSIADSATTKISSNIKEQLPSIAEAAGSAVIAQVPTITEKVGFNIKEQLPSITNELQSNLNPLIDNAIDRATSTENKQKINQLIQEGAGAATKGATGNIGGIAGWLVGGGGGGANKNVNNKPKAPPNQRERERMNSKEQQELIQISPRNRRKTVPFDPSTTSPITTTKLEKIVEEATEQSNNLQPDELELRRQNKAASIIQSKFRKDRGHRDTNYNKNLEHYNRPRAFYDVLPRFPPVKGRIYQQKGIEELNEFGRRKRKQIRINLKILYKDLKKIK